MKKYSKEVLEAEEKMIMEGHRKQVKASIVPLTIGISVSLLALFGYVLYEVLSSIL